MCGISGGCSFETLGIREGIVQTMTRALEHRGPDQEGYYFDTAMRVGLGHRRLSVIDLSSSGRQPIFNEDKTKVIVFNGEIYNFKELREALEKKGHIFRSHTDTESIIHLYEEDGADAVKKLRGMFALAIWDTEKQELFLARDRIGKKPLYYSVIGKRLYFASEIQALYDVPEIDKELDYSSIDLFLTYGYIPSPHTIYRRIRKLPPAHLLQFNAKGCSISRYWAPDYRQKVQFSYEEGKEELRRLLLDAVKVRLVSDVPLGAFLSGGVDSSTIVALMCRLSSGPVKTFSIGFPNETFNELPYARQIAQTFQTEHHEFIVEPNLLEVLPALVQHYGEPFGDSSALPTWYLSKITKAHVTVALNGDGGDELFGGYPWYERNHFLNTITARVNRPLIRLIHRAGRNVFSARIQKGLALLSNPEERRYQMLRSFIGAEERQTLYHEDLKRRLMSDTEDYLSRLYDLSIQNDYDRAFQADLLSYLPEDLLVKVDRASMAHGLECRSPLLDQELVEFSCRLPPSWKIQNGKGKLIFKETVQDLFLPRFLERRKMGFSMPVGEWFRKELKSYIFEMIVEGPLTRIPLLRREPLITLLDQHFQRKRNLESLLWNCLILRLWFDEYASAS